MIEYALSSAQRLQLGDDALRTFEQFRQQGRRLRETGGQLFGQVEAGCVMVAHATGPRPADLRSRFTFRPSRSAERAEITRMHELGLHYLGDWHTHPQPRPCPSGTDLDSIGETARLSRNTLGPLVLIVVGTDPAPAGLFVCIHDGQRPRILNPVR